MNGITFDESSGISKEDQRDIINQIDEITAKSRITVTPEVFKIKALKKGYFFPFIINLIALLILGGGIALFYIFFHLESIEIKTQSNPNYARGQYIIGHLKSQHEEDLNKKNQEISEIQNNLEGVNQELANLQENMDEEVEKRKTELEAQYERELAVERARLEQAGLSQEEIDSQMDQFKAQQAQQYETEVARIKAEEEAKLLQQEQELQKAKSEYNTLLAKAEADLAAMEEKYARELAQAEEQVKALTEQKERYDIINNQILGYYNAIKKFMAEGNFQSALNYLTQLRTYLDNPAVVNNPDILKRREVEFFVIDSLTNLIQKELSKEQVDTQSLIASAALVTEIRELVIAADQAYRSGDITRAEALYLNALELIPEVYKSHSYFINQIDDIEKYRQKQVKYYLSNANSYYREKAYKNAILSYAQALQYLPSNPDTDIMLDQIQKMGFEMEWENRQESHSTQAQGLLTRADQYMAQEDYSQAINTYLILIQRYPYSTQMETALQSMGRAIELQDQAFRQRLAQLSANTGEQSQEIQEYQAEIAALKTSLAEKEERISYLENRGGYSDEELERVGKSIINTSELNLLKKIAAEYERIQKDYKEYTEKEDQLAFSSNISDIVQGKSHLDAFISSNEMDTLFPGLIVRIKKYDRAFERLGRESALNYVIKVIDNLSQYSTAEDRLSYLDNEILKAGSDELIIILLRSLKDLISQQEI